MTYSTIETNRLANIAIHSGPSPLGQWLMAALRRLVSRPAAAPAPRDRVREAAELRAFAEGARRTDSRFAAELFAAADRHELLDV